MLSIVKRLGRAAQRLHRQRSHRAGRRILFVANALIPTLQLRFIRPLAALQQQGDVELSLLTEQEIRERFGKSLHTPKAEDWAVARLHDFDPDVIIFCRYSGPHAERFLAEARTRSVPTIFHIDDDLLGVPIDLGEKKFKYHNDPMRKQAVRLLLDHADIVNCPCRQLADRLRSYGFRREYYVNRIPCAGEILSEAEMRPTTKIGYMGFDHAHDLQIALPALVEILREFPHLTFELFGPIPKPSALEEFGDQVITLPPIRDYSQFLAKLAGLRWDIGICPLAKTNFNAVKTHIKWVEYSAVGAATIATRGMIYDTCCSAGCGLLVDTDEAWYQAFISLIKDERERFETVCRAQESVRRHYSEEILREDVLALISSALPGEGQHEMGGVRSRRHPDAGV
jgi:glycosyltransferase involved in cell wall biosynthesis